MGGRLTQNLGLPGQWFQLETGLAYNWRRHPADGADADGIAGRTAFDVFNILRKGREDVADSVVDVSAERAVNRTGFAGGSNS